MNISPTQLITFSVAGFICSFIIHVLAALNLYTASNTVIMILSAGILIVWLQSSKNMKTIYKSIPEKHPWKTIFSYCPHWAKYLFYFFLVYAVINFGLTMSFGKGDDFLNFEVSQVKIRGISGFWLAFYLLGIIFGYALKRHYQEKIKHTNNK